MRVREVELPVAYNYTSAEAKINSLDFFVSFQDFWVFKEFNSPGGLRRFLRCIVNLQMK